MPIPPIIKLKRGAVQYIPQVVAADAKISKSNNDSMEFGVGVAGK